MGETKKGIDLILLYRILKKSTEEAAWKLAYQTEHTYKKSRSNDTVATKDGNVVKTGEIEYELTGNSICSVGDKHIDEMSDAFDDDEAVEIWIIDKAEKGTGQDADKFKAEYVQAKLASFGKTANSEDDVELELEFSVYGRAKKGFATLTNEQAEVVQYAFKDTVKETEGEGE